MNTGENKKTIGDDLKLTSVLEGIGPGMGTWITGTLSGHYFQAKIYSEPASNRTDEIERIRISKLSVRRLEDNQVVFVSDRGTETLPKDPLDKEKVTREVVSFLTTGVLAHYDRTGNQPELVADELKTHWKNALREFDAIERSRDLAPFPLPCDEVEKLRSQLDERLNESSGDRRPRQQHKNRLQLDIEYEL